jgi:hypothetical protein
VSVRSAPMPSRTATTRTGVEFVRIGSVTATPPVSGREGGRSTRAAREPSGILPRARGAEAG